MTIKRGSRGEAVTILQTQLNKLGFELEADGVFGSGTEEAVRELQSLFNYSIDGIVGEGTQSLIQAQLGYGWNRNDPNAKERAAKSNPVKGT